MRQAHIGLVGIALLASGCYLAHGLGGDDGPGDGSVVLPDGRVVHPDGGGDGSDGWDGGVDSGIDGGPIDGGWDSGGRDAAPPEPGHPNPGSCRIEPTVHAFRDPVLETRWPDGPVVHPGSLHVCSTPLVIDLDPAGDAVDPEVVFVSYEDLGRPEPPGVLRIWNPRTGETLSSPALEGDEGLLEATGNLAAGDIDGDGDNEILGVGVYDSTIAYEHDGTILWQSPYPTASDRGLRWARSIGGAPTLADLEGDGTIEVVIGRNVLEGATGEHRWTGPSGTGRAINNFLGPISCVADLDDDGVQEVVSGHTAFRADGEIYWNNPDALDGFCAVADLLDADAGPEVVLVSNGYVRILDGQSGDVLWLRQLEGRVRMSIGGAPTVADFDGDGRPEIGVAHGGAYGVYDPQCESAGMGRCTAEGLLWQQRTYDDSSSGTGSSVFDFNGDGRAEVVYNDQYWFSVYDGVTGRALFQHRNSSRTRTENPTIADVDNDGDAEIVFSANSEAAFLGREFLTDPGVEIWGDSRGRWVGARRIWNQHAYHITNVTETGTVVSGETPSWSVLNAYRQNLREGGDVLVVPDLWGGHGSYECLGPGRAVMRVEVQNWGLERVGAGVVVAFYRGHPDRGGERVGEAVTTGGLEPRGGSEVVTLEVSLSEPVVDWYARLDDPVEPAGGSVAECREGNNDVLIWRPWCP